MTDFDVTIVGAGPAGATAALLLARAGVKVALFDRARFPRDKVCGDGITPRGARLLKEMGVLADIEPHAFSCRGVTLRGSDAHSFDIDLTPEAGQPSDLLVIPRLKLDQLLLQSALREGPAYFDESKVDRIDSGDEHATILLSDGRPVTSRIALVATGAESQLLRASGLLTDKPRLEHAARGYFEGVEGLSSRVTLFFDGVDMPGYGWIFPTSPTSANIGCGVFSRNGLPQMERLKTLVSEHPLLRRQLRNATQSAPLRAYPLRTDFTIANAGRDRILCLGEAAGLVNPITGEGIDYAFESARFACDAILSALAKNHGAGTLAIYRKHLHKRFSRRFAIYRWVQQNCLSSGQADDFLATVQKSPRLQRTVVNGLFGRARPKDYFALPVLLPALGIALRGARLRRQAK